MIVRCYDLIGTTVSISAEDHDLLLPFETYLAPFTCAGMPKSDFAIELGRATSRAPPANATMVFEGELALGAPCTLSVTGTKSWLHAPGVLSIFSDQASATTRIDVEDTLASAAGSMAVLRVIDLALQAGRQALLHGAAFTAPGAPNKTILLFAPSGRGKTTTALALGLAGFGLITDDAIVLQNDRRGKPARNLVWGLPRPLKVHENTAALLPALAPCLTSVWDEFREQPISLATLSQTVAISSAALYAVPACALIILGPRTTGAHILEPIAKADVLIELAADNVRRRAEGMLDSDIWRFGRIASLVAALPCLRLQVGAPLATLANVIGSASRGWVS